MAFLKPLTVFVLLLLVQEANAADFEKGLAAAERGDFKAAYAEWLPLAEAGDKLAQYNLGLMYRNGDGVRKSDKKAFFWFGKAASQGLPVAQSRVGWMYANGVGIGKDLRKAIRWTWLAAKQGDRDAMSNLGAFQSSLADMYMTGSEGYRESAYFAYLWHSLAAENGVQYSASFKDAMQPLLTAKELKRAKAEMKSCVSSNFARCGEPD